MSGGVWTSANPGAGSPADIRADASRRRSRASRTRTAGGQVSAAGQVGPGWRGQAATSLTSLTADYQQELDLLAAQFDATADALSRYANDVDDIQHRQRTIEANQAAVAEQLWITRSRLSAETHGIHLNPDASRTASFQLEGRIESLTSQASGLHAQMDALAQQRTTADNTAIATLSSTRAGGKLASILTTATTTPDGGLTLRRPPTLTELAHLSELELATLFALSPDLAHTIAATTDPTTVATWWRGLTADQQTALVLGGYTLIGQLSGIPAGTRIAANRIVAFERNQWITERIADLKSQLADAHDRPVSGGRVPSGAGKLHAIETIESELAKLGRESVYLQKVIVGSVQLYLYKPENQSIIQMIGTVDQSTETVITYVPGTFTSTNSFYNADVQQVGTWIDKNAEGVVTFVWKVGSFPGENEQTGQSNLLRILEASDEPLALQRGAELAAFQQEMHISSPILESAKQVAIGHSWALAALTASEIAGAVFDQVHSLAGAGMPRRWEPIAGTDYYHWSYTDLLSMAQESGTVWGGNNPLTHEAFTSRVYVRDGDHDILGSLGPVPKDWFPDEMVVAGSATPIESHNLIAQNAPDNQEALEDMLDAMVTEVLR